MNIQLITKVQQLTEELLDKLGVSADIVVEMEEEQTVNINITSKPESKREDIDGEAAPDNMGILIGYHGFTLRALQLILALMISREREEWLRVLIDIDGYRERREASIRALAKRTMDKARFLKEEVALPSMNAYDRRLVHMAVAEVEDMDTESVGEELRRRVVIRPKLSADSTPKQAL
ncbi:KH domain-containing protein [Patescibacteria group bacterium]|nr:KH domain-containing protein [Patescibacteria group bacterium]